MQEATVTILINDDGTVDIGKFSEVNELRPVKELIDRLRKEAGENRRENGRLTNQLTTLEQQVEDLTLSAQSATDLLKAEQKAVKELSTERDTLKAQAEAYTALGSVEQLSAEREDAKYGRERRVTDRVSKAAKDAQLNPDALLALQGIGDWDIQWRDQEVKHPYNGTSSQVSVPFVVERDAEGKEIKAEPFRDAVLTRYAPLSASLTKGVEPVSTPSLPSSSTGLRPDPVQVPGSLAPAPTISANALLPNQVDNSLLTGLQEAFGQ